jgi:hypothetical protein
MTKPKPPAPQWRKGQSGNPAGRPRGIVDRRSALKEAIAGELPSIVRKLVVKAKDGDVQAAGLILSRCLPPLRPSRELIQLDALPDGATAVEIASALVRASVQGRIPCDAASEVVTAMAAAARVLETEELAARVATLESKHVPQS